MLLAFPYGWYLGPEVRFHGTGVNIGVVENRCVKYKPPAFPTIVDTF